MTKGLNSFTTEQYGYLKQLIKWYSELDNFKEFHEVKVKWLRGLVIKGVYTNHHQKLLNKMVKQYNERN
jgi:hypothetical protein